MNPPTMLPQSYPPPFKQPPFMNPPQLPTMPLATNITPYFGSDIMPKESLYVNNLNEKIKPEGNCSISCIKKS